MKIFIALLIMVFSLSENSAAQNNPSTDSIIDPKQAPALINEIISGKKPPESDKIPLISAFTKYGFKNLFSKFRYNPAIPYAAQVNPNAELYMQGYLKNNSAYLLKLKSYSGNYFSFIDHILSQYGLPTELKYLAVIESDLKTSATSWVGAGGPWQFMPGTARMYGLTVNRQTDDRRDYFKSTHAAARYLLKLYQQFNDWLLVIAAYNGGSGAVSSAIKKSGSNNFWRLQYYLPEESRNHVKKFIATHYIMESDVPAHKPENNTDSISADTIANTVRQIISGKYNSVVIARTLQMDLKEFNKFNPSFDEQIGIKGQYVLTLPQEKMKIFAENKSVILNESVQILLNEPDVSNPVIQSKTKVKRKIKKP